MKRLEKIRLINWHRFVNETIELDDSVLISGENGAGKSTLLDAVQFVITCSKANFNKAAHEKGKRNLNGYVRCKTGREDRPYERTGEISSHVALQFYDEARKQPFVVGTVLDSASEEKEPNVVWYLMEKQELEDSLFLQGTQVKSISVFRATNKNIRTWATTQTEAKKLMLSRFGRLEDKFFSLIPKALAFKPIHDIKDFVYSYVLDEKEVNIDTLKENVRSYQDLERMLQEVRTKIGELERINEKEADIENYLRVDRHQEYYLARADVELTEQAQADAEEKKKYARFTQEDLGKQKKTLQKSSEDLQETITNLSAQLRSDEEYQALHELERRREELEEALVQDRDEKQKLNEAAGKALSDVKQLLKAQDTDPCMEQYAGMLKDLDHCEELAELNLCLEKVIDWKKRMYALNQENLAEIRVELHEKNQKMTGLQEKISQLEKKRLTYPPEVTLLAQKIREQFRQAGRSGEVRVLCELLDITNPAWQNAVEGYLNTQRFYLLVEPDDFDLAISVYDQLRENKKAYGAGLINTGKLEEYDEAPEGSLAEVVTSKSLWARRYINMVLGRVHRCSAYQDLKRYPTAITRQCMRYQNHVVTAIRPEIYRTPYIGSEAYLRQLEQCREQEKALREEIESLNQKVRRLTALTELYDADADVDVKYRLHVLEELRSHETQYQQCKENIKRMEENQTLIEKRMQIDSLQQELKDLQNKISDMDVRIGRSQQEEAQCTEKLGELLEVHAGQAAVLAQIVQELDTEFAACSKEYERQREERPLPKFKENYERARKANQTLKEKAEKDMIQLMNNYKVAHDFGAAASLEGYPEFESEYDKLKNSQLLSYEEKVQRARGAAEEEFREQFLSRLQENIKQAQTEFRELNRSLQDIHFSHEQYKFLYEPKHGLEKYYQMIMDDFNVLQGESIFSGTFEEAHREVIEEFFEKLTLDDENSTKTLEEYTDYRSYLDYDIKIQNDDGSYMLYSKVSQEKSGGETQTPFYITVAASFMQLYRNSIGGDAIGLVMFDEAFNNMDYERIAGVLEFMTNSKLQVIISAPPEKIQYIGPAMKKVLLIMEDDKVSYVEDFGRV